jgi:hypothetical protein
MLRKVAIALYGFGAILAVVLALLFFTARLELLIRTPFGFLEAAYTFVPMVVLMLGALRAQRSAARVVWSLLPIVLIAAALLVVAYLSHAFPERATPFAVAHLLIAVPIGIALLVRVGAPPSNNRWRGP